MNCKHQFEHAANARFCYRCGKKLPEAILPPELIRQAIQETRYHGYALCLVAGEQRPQHVKIYEYLPDQPRSILGAIDANGHWYAAMWRSTGRVHLHRNRPSIDDLRIIEGENHEHVPDEIPPAE